MLSRFLLVFVLSKSAVGVSRDLFLDDGRYCNADGSTTVGQQGDFRFNSIIFASKYQPQCNCDVFPNGDDELHCSNSCETCFDDICGRLETTERRTANSLQAEDYSLCMTYSAGVATGKTCFSYNLEDPELLTDEDDFVNCKLEHNGIPCTWCHMFSSGCIQSNCTNIVPDARVNTCRDFNRGLEKQFKMAALVNSLPQSRAIGLGSCAEVGGANSGDPIDSLQLGPPTTAAPSGGTRNAVSFVSFLAGLLLAKVLMIDC